MARTGRRAALRKPFYGWWIVLASLLFHGLSGAAFGFTFGQYLLRIEDEFGWSNFAISGTYSASLFLAGVLSPAHGWLLDHLSPRSLMMAGIAVFGAGFMLLSLTQSFAFFFFVIMLMSVGANLSGWLTLTTVTTRWFRRKRSFALGLSSTGIGLAGILSSIIAWSLGEHGWQATAAGSGLAVLAIGLPLSYVLRGYPEDYGMRQDGDAEPPPPASGAAPAPSAPEEDFTAAEAMRDRSFWFVSLGHGIALITVFVVLVHLPKHMVDGLGWSATSAQNVVALVTVMAIVGQVGGGYLGDRYNKTRMAALCMLAHAAAMVILALTSSGALAVAAAVLHGIAWGTRGPLMMSIRADYYGRRHFGQIAGYSNVMVMLGPLVGPTFAGRMEDAFNNYSGAFLAMGIFVGVSSLLFFAARKPPAPRRVRAAAPAAAR